MQTAIAHERRFSNWCKLSGRPTMVLAHLVEVQLVPAYLTAGFRRTSIYMNDPTDMVSGREIHLEREKHGEIEFVTFNFDKYRRPAFQFHIGCRKAAPNQAWVRSAKVVARSTQLFHFWGKPWWLPSRWWSERMSLRVIDRLVAKTPEVLAFLEEGRRSSSLSESSISSNQCSAGHGS